LSETLAGRARRVVDHLLADVDRPLVRLGVVLAGERLTDDPHRGEALVTQLVGDALGVVAVRQDDEVLGHGPYRPRPGASRGSTAPIGPDERLAAPTRYGRSCESFASAPPAENYPPGPRRTTVSTTQERSAAVPRDDLGVRARGRR